jgi:hypothetical protein
MYYNLWRNGEELPNPYTFNTNSLDDIRNFLAWEIVDNFTSGDECLKGTNISSYNLVDIDWDQYDSSTDEIKNLIKSAQSKCNDEIISNYKTFDTGFYNNPDAQDQLFFNINVSKQFTLVISENPIDAEGCYGEYLEDNEFMFDQKPWL